MRQFIQNIIIAAIFCFSLSAYANNNQNSNNEDEQQPASAYQKIIEDYKKHLAKTPPEIREEIKKYRLAIAKLQKQKRDLYIKLSKQSQNFLKAEENFRNMLPVSTEDKIDTNNQQNISVDQSNRK